ncbi:chorismate mutase [Leptolyngbya sp. Heron Island J]|uniref:chorismate mutase n=1 Tax=Leptolyngbya sp. Heron Island J TaxID=1385935 RepID=UPI0003B9AA45|nr:chorismate mutase [Leptolyngbya sp. Heron Island J]ESA33039.1 chorismate mutase [Leptolyngbya sp. Heron Island J]
MQQGEIGNWRVRAIRGATTVPENSVAAMTDAVTELLDALETNNPITPDAMISVTFSVTSDLDAIFPAAIARQRPNWDTVPLLDVQHMQVVGSLPMCIRFLIHTYMTIPQADIYHPYLRGASGLRPDWSSVDTSAHAP